MKPPTLDDPEYRRKVVRACLLVSPAGFMIAVFLGTLLGADTATSLLMGAVLFLGCIGAAGLFHLRGRAAGKDVMWAVFLLRLFGIR